MRFAPARNAARMRNRATKRPTFATLYHWDLPQVLQDRWRGWESRDTAKAFADDAAYVAEKLSDRIRHFFTINEFTTFVEWGHGTGLLAPGLKLPAARLNQVRHHAVLAHGLAVQAIRAKALSGTKVGLVENIVAGVPMPSCLRRRRCSQVHARGSEDHQQPSRFRRHQRLRPEVRAGHQCGTEIQDPRFAAQKAVDLYGPKYGERVFASRQVAVLIFSQSRVGPER